MKRVVIGLVVLAALVVGGVVVYVQVVRDDAPAPLAFSDDGDDEDGSGSTDDGNGNGSGSGDGNGDTNGNGSGDGDGALDVDDLAGPWQVADGTEVGYRVIEDFIGGLQNAEAVGRTDEVTGTATFEVAEHGGTVELTLTEAEFSADLTSVTSDERERDNQFRGRIMSTDEFPEARFTLTEPLELGSPPVDGTEVAVTAIGTLELRGVTQDVQADMQAKVIGGRIEILGTIPVIFDDYDIPDPSNPFVSTRDNGTLEFLLVLVPSA